MRIRILTISERQPDWIQHASAEYLRRMPRHLPTEIIELPLAKRREDVARTKIEEGERLLAAASKSTQLVALDEHGAAWTSVQLSDHLQRWQQDGRDLTFVIGGPDGLSQAVIATASQRWSLSKLTLPHGMVRVLLAEQLYRAHTILENHPYHRA